MTKRLITGEEALEQIGQCLNAADDIEDVAAIYTAVVRDAKVVAAEPTGESGWPGLRLEVED